MSSPNPSPSAGIFEACTNVWNNDTKTYDTNKPKIVTECCLDICNQLNYDCYTECSNTEEEYEICKNSCKNVHEICKNSCSLSSPHINNTYTTPIISKKQRYKYYTNTNWYYILIAIFGSLIIVIILWFLLMRYKN